MTAQVTDDIRRTGGIYVGLPVLLVSTRTELDGPHEGMHCDLLTAYASCDSIIPETGSSIDAARQCLRAFCQAADFSPTDILPFDMIVCPAVGDIVPATHMAHLVHVYHGIDTGPVIADKANGGKELVIERLNHAESIRGKRVLIFNDRISGGGTTLKAIAQARAAGAEVVGVVSFSAADDITAEKLGVPTFVCLDRLSVRIIKSYEADDEIRALPVVVNEALGHGATFRKENPEWPGGFCTVEPGSTKITMVD